jgi:predicted DNA-binding protein
MSNGIKISLRLNDAQAQKLDRLMDSTGQTQSQCIQGLIEASTPPPTAIDIEAYKTILAVTSELRQMISDADISQEKLIAIEERMVQLGNKVVNAVLEKT